MTKRRVLLMLLFCLSTGGLTSITLFQTRILARDSGRSPPVSEAGSRREAERRLREHDKELRRRQQEIREKHGERKPEIARRRTQHLIEWERRRKEFQKELEEAGGIACWVAKMALGVTEERWKPIQAKLERVQLLRDQANSVVGASVSNDSSDSRTGPSGPKLQWERPWKDKPLNELTQAQRLARQLRMLLERKNATPQAFRRRMADLRKARSEESEVEEQLDEARRDLRQILTTRQEAVLVLLQWL